MFYPFCVCLCVNMFVNFVFLPPKDMFLLVSVFPPICVFVFSFDCVCEYVKEYASDQSRMADLS